MQRKFLPIIIACLVLFGTISLQIGLDIMQSKAQTVEIKKKEAHFYQSLFKKLKLEYSDSSVEELAKIKQPLVLINFWATWCKPCVKEFKYLKKLEEKLGSKNLKIVGINCDREGTKKTIKNKVLNLKKKKSITFKSVLDIENKYLDEFKVNTIPATFIFSRGNLIYLKHQYTDFANEELIKLLQSKI